MSHVGAGVTSTLGHLNPLGNRNGLNIYLLVVCVFLGPALQIPNTD